jgi:hypothetical protein
MTTSDPTGALDEAYERLHATGPEFEGWLSNHGPMAAEAMVRHGHAGQVSGWLDGYIPRLEDFPAGSGPIGADWAAALGDPRRIADWTVFFRQQTAGQPWQAVLNTWWLRLLPGSASSATHGIIRVGHAVRALEADGDDLVHVTELAHALAYWAARWQEFPGSRARGLAAGDGTGRRVPVLAPAAALDAVPRIARQSGGYRDRLTHLTSLMWPEPVPDVSPERARDWLITLINETTLRYAVYAHGNPVMLVHSATAPTAILRALPALDRDVWVPSVAAAWEAAAALTAIYAPAEAAPVPRASVPATIEEVFARAVEHGDEHVIKFADTAADVYARTGDRGALASAMVAAELTPVPGAR